MKPCLGSLTFKANSPEENETAAYASMYLTFKLIPPPFPPPKKKKEKSKKEKGNEEKNKSKRKKISATGHS